MQRKLILRIELLEARMIPKPVDPWVFVSCPITEERRRNLEPGEKVVLDYFRHSGGLLIYAAERVTTDAKDYGRRCEPGGFLEDVIRELHEECDFRERDGCCKTCENTPVANT
jgi:hypothetical protein